MNNPVPQPLLAVAVPAELERAVAETGLSADGASSLRSAYSPHFVSFDEVAMRAKAILPTAPKAARDVRLQLKAIRVAADKTRKLLKEDSLRRGKAIDGIYNVLEYQLVPVEQAMEAIEKAEEIAEAQRKAALKAVRAEALTPYADPTFYDLGGMADAQWEMLLSGAKLAHEARLVAAAKAEADRIAAELAAAAAKAQRAAEEAAEREAMRAENERLRLVAEEQRKAREAAEAAATAERLKAAQEREVAAAAARKLQAEAERLAQVEQHQRHLAEAELRKREQAERERSEADLLAQRKAAAAPDKEKLLAMAETIRQMRAPALTCEGGAAVVLRIEEQILRFSRWLEAEAGKL